MNKAVKFLLLVILLTACGPTRKPVPVGVVPSAPDVSQSDQRAGLQVRQEMLGNFQEVDDPQVRQRVVEITGRLLRASGSDRDNWNVTVLKDDGIQNAAATRGNQIFVWTGMLQAVRSDAELAAVLAHEISHVLANHVVPTQEEVLRRMLSQAAGAIAGNIAQERAAGAGQLVGGLTTSVAQGIAVNPYTQRLELEADRIGLFLMADAGYDPRAAVEFWRRFGGGTSKLTEFFSSHPPSEKRMNALEALIPRALERYRS